MIDARFVPIQLWPGLATPEGKQRRAPFKAGYPSTLKLIETELWHLKAHSVLIQAFFGREDIHIDGRPKGGRAPSKPGIILTFQSGTASVMSFPCDTYSHWEDNLRAIGLALSALRAIRRYGVGKTTEQYRGFAQLPAPDPEAKRMAALRFLSRITGWSASQITSDPTGAYRLAAATLHPDKGGSGERFIELGKHMEAIR